MGGTLNIGGIINPSRRAATTSLRPGGVVKRGGVVCRGGVVERDGPIETGSIVKKGHMLEDADSKIKCTDTFYLQDVLVHFQSSLPERSFLLTRKRWWEVCCHWRYILVGSIFLLVLYFGFVAEL
jgi:hypothetical protein